MLKSKLTGWIWGGALAAGLLLAAIQLTDSAAPGAYALDHATPPATRTAQVDKAAPPAASVQAPAPATTIHAVELAVQKARAGGAGENEAYRLRAAALSTQTIALLSEREQAENEWQQRLQTWRAKRAGLNQIDSAALRGRLFSPDEQTRLDAYEQTDTPQLILR